MPAALATVPQPPCSRRSSSLGLQGNWKCIAIGFARSLPAWRVRLALELYPGHICHATGNACRAALAGWRAPAGKQYADRLIHSEACDKLQPGQARHMSTLEGRCWMKESTATSAAHNCCTYP